MNKKQKNKLTKIVLASVLYVICIVAEHTMPLPYYTTILIYIIPYIIIGFDIIAKVAKNLINGQIFDERFLMTVATIAAFIIGEYSESVATMIFYQVGELFESYAVDRSRKSISSLIDIMPEYANLQTDDGIIQADPEDVCEGSIIVVKPGEKIPIDGIVLSGCSHLDTSAITGESKHSFVDKDDYVYSGSINCEGLITLKTTKSYGNSTVSKIMELVEDASSKKAPAENFITKFAKFYTPAVVILALLLAIATPMLMDMSIFEGIRRGCIFLVVSCPCALVISVPLSFFCGIGAASKKGILIKGGNYLDLLSKTDTIAFDKTGTLTKGVFEVSGVFPANNRNEILRIGAMCEAYSNHPIAVSIKNSYGKETDISLISDYSEIPGKGVKATFKKNHYLCGNAELMKEHGIEPQKNSSEKTAFYIAKEKKLIGTILISDTIKPEAAKAIANLKSAFIKKTIMLSGDTKTIAEEIGNNLGIDEIHSELLPHEKVAVLEKLMQQHRHIAYVGDGINDAPVLMRADVGIAMGAIGSDAAIESSDVVLLNDDISKLSTLFKIAKKTVSIAGFNIVFAIGVKLLILILGALGIANMWLAIFADVGVSVLAILNSMRVLRVK